MTTGAVDQAGAYALIGTTSTANIAQGGAVALAAITPVAPVAQAGLYALVSGPPCATEWAQFWTITRRDGEVFRFTSHDKDVTFHGATYLACRGILPSASESAAEIGAAGNQEIAGLFSAEAGGITATDLEAGRFDGARVTSWLGSYADNTDPPRLLLSGTLGKVTRRPSGFTTELLGDGAVMQQMPLTRVLKPDCDYVFGDPKTCRKDTTGLIVTGTVDVGGARTFIDAARAETAGYFRRGRVTFTSGDNDGVTAEIKDHLAGGLFELWPKLPFAISAGDAYEMVPGCTNLKAADGGCNGCIAWDNVVNYGGFDTVPGTDATVSSAGVRTS